MRNTKSTQQAYSEMKRRAREREREQCEKKCNRLEERWNKHMQYTHWNI